MSELNAPAPDVDRIYELLDVSFAAGAWSLLDVCCMCASSKLLRAAWLQLLRQQPNPAWLLAAVADAAHAKTLKLQAKATAVVCWLPNSLPEARLAAHSSVPAGLLAIPSMPLDLAEELCKLGVKVPYTAIVAAARQRIAGVDVWIRAQCPREPASDVPPVVALLYDTTASDDNIYQLTDAELHDYLHLTINSSSDAVPGRALTMLRDRMRWPPACVPASEALALLQTAVERKHVTMLQRIAMLLGSRMEEELTCEQLVPAFQRAIALDVADVATNWSRVRQLVALPAAQQLPAEAVSALMNMAVQAGDSRNLQALLQLPGSMLVSPAELAGIVEATAGTGYHSSLQHLARIPAFDELEPAAAAAAMLAAVRVRSTSSLAILLDSRSAVTGDDVLVPALDRALCAGERHLIYALLNKAQFWGQAFDPYAVEAARFSADGLGQVLKAAVQNSNLSAFERLWNVPAAAGLQGKHLGQLLRAATACRDEDFRHYAAVVHSRLLFHPAWGSVSEEYKASWQLRQAVQAASCGRQPTAAPKKRTRRHGN